MDPRFETKAKVKCYVYPPRPTPQQCFETTVDKLRDRNTRKHDIMVFADGVFWGIGRPDIIRTIFDTEDLADRLIELWNNGTPQEVKAVTLICKYGAWDLDPRDE